MVSGRKILSRIATVMEKQPRIARGIVGLVDCRSMMSGVKAAPKKLVDVTRPRAVHLGYKIMKKQWE